MTNKGPASWIGPVVLVACWGLWLYNKDEDDMGSGRSHDAYADDSGQVRLTPEEAINDHWDEIKEYVNGSESVEACSVESGNCYELEADISSGVIDTLHFNNGGGWLNLAADFDSDGAASDVDDQGRSWEFALDLDSSPLVESALADWASANDTVVEP